jgi:hypothetical protein
MPYEDHSGRRCSIKALLDEGFSELPNNIWDYNAD